MRNALSHNKCDWKHAKMQMVCDQLQFTSRSQTSFILQSAPKFGKQVELNTEVLLTGFLNSKCVLLNG